MFLLLCAGGFTAFAQRTIAGQVVAEGTGLPVPGASVYINNTATGVVTAADGSFQLNEVPPGDLVVSCINFETLMYPVKPEALPLKLRFELRPRIRELENVVVGGWVTETWEKWGSVFLETFLGATPAGRRCVLTNKDVLRFRFYKKQNILEVVAEAPLLIDNPKLGYIIQYDLLDFKINLTEHSSYYAGFALFSGRQGSLKRSVQKNRKAVYYGSPMHFMRALYFKRTVEEGFQMKRMTRVRNAEKERVRQIRKNGAARIADKRLEGTAMNEPTDSAAYYDTVMFQKDYEEVYADHDLTPDSLLVGTDRANKVVYWNNYLAVLYVKEKEPAEFLRYTGEQRPAYYPRSWIQLKGPLIIDARGNWSPPQNIVTSGYWWWSDKVGNMLPLDYEP